MSTNLGSPVDNAPQIKNGYDPKKGHYGQDIPVASGTEVKATATGKVIRASSNETPNGSFGNVVIIEHQDECGKYFYTLYAHLSKFSVKVGDKVAAGQQIGLSGNTG